MKIKDIIILTFSFIFVILFNTILGLFFELNNNIKFIIDIVLRISYVIFIIIYLRIKKITINKSLDKSCLYLITFILVLCTNLIAILLFKLYRNNIYNNFYLDLVFIFVASIFEEIYFRGIIYNYLSKNLKNKNKYIVSILITSIYFALFHFLNLINESLSEVIFQAGYTIFSGILFTFIYFYSNNIILSISSHFIFNTANSFLYDLLYGKELDYRFIIVGIVLGILSFIYGIILYIKKIKKDSI